MDELQEPVSLGIFGTILGNRREDELGMSPQNSKLYVEGDDGFGFAGLAAQSKGYANGALAVQDMINGNVDFVIIDEAPAKAIAANFNA